MLEKYWIKCPICNGKTRVQVFYNTVLRNFPLFCPKCKLTHIVDVEKLEIIEDVVNECQKCFCCFNQERCHFLCPPSFSVLPSQ